MKEMRVNSWRPASILVLCCACLRAIINNTADWYHCTRCVCSVSWHKKEGHPVSEQPRVKCSNDPALWTLFPKQVCSSCLDWQSSNVQLLLCTEGDKNVEFFVEKVQIRRANCPWKTKGGGATIAKPQAKKQKIQVGNKGGGKECLGSLVKPG